MTETASTLLSTLEHAGFHPVESRVLLHLHEAGTATSGDLQEALGLTQPRVSAVTRRLAGDGWVRVGIEKRYRAGRPQNAYRLRRPLPELLWELAKRHARARQHERQHALRHARLSRAPAHA